MSRRCPLYGNARGSVVTVLLGILSTAAFSLRVVDAEPLVNRVAGKEGFLAFRVRNASRDTVYVGPDYSFEVSEIHRDGRAKELDWGFLIADFPPLDLVEAKALSPGQDYRVRLPYTNGKRLSTAVRSLRVVLRFNRGPYKNGRAGQSGEVRCSVAVRQ